MDAVVVDTNIIVGANDASQQASEECIMCCQKWLRQIQHGSKKLIIDDGDLIVKEYRRNVNPRTQSRSGELFWLWIVRNQWDPERCIRVTITPPDAGASFKEFPPDPALSDFDTDDRKFITVAVVYERDTGQKATILQAVDSKWYPFQDALARNGLKVEFVCKADILRMLAGRTSSSTEMV